MKNASYYVNYRKERGLQQNERKCLFCYSPFSFPFFQIIGTDFADTGEQVQHFFPFLGCEFFEDHVIQFFDAFLDRFFDGHAGSRRFDADAAAVVGVEDAVDEAAFLHAVEDAGNGGVFDAQDVGDFLRRQCFMFPETGQDTILAGRDAEFRQVLGENQKDFVL